MFQYSIVATTFNDENNVAYFLNNIIQQTVLPSEIVIADGGSGDKTVQTIEAFRDKTQVPIVLLSGQRLNIAEGYNEAIRKAGSEYIGIAGVGNTYAPDYFELLSKEIRSKNLDGAYSPIRGKNQNLFSTLYNHTFLNGNKGQYLEIASNHGAILKKSIFEQLNYFYTGFYYAGEDTEFYSLVKDRGYKLAIVPGAYMYWDTPDSFSAFSKQVRVYTIAGLQINSETEIAIAKRNIAKLCCTFLLLLTTLLLGIGGFSTTVRVSGIVVCLLLLTYKKLLNPLVLLRAYLQIVYCFKNKSFQDTVRRG